MREVTESVLRFTWAMSLVGVRQAANLLTPRRGWETTTRELDAVSGAAGREMGETMRGFYRAGDRLQAGMVDTVSRLFTGSWSEPGKALNDVWESLDRTRAAVREELSRSDGGGGDA